MFLVLESALGVLKHAFAELLSLCVVAAEVLAPKLICAALNLLRELVFLVTALWCVSACLLGLELFPLSLLALEVVLDNPVSTKLILLGWITPRLAVTLLLRVLAAGLVWLVEELVLAERRVAERVSCRLVRVEQLLHPERRALQTIQGLRAHILP